MRQIKFLKGLNIIIAVLGVTMVVYHIIAILLSPLDPILHVNTHLTFVLLLVFLPALAIAVQKRQKLYVIAFSILLVLTIIGVVYIYLFSIDLQFRAARLTTTDLIIGTILAILVMVACWRAQGVILPLVGLIFIAYALFGHYLPPPLGHGSIDYSALVLWLGMCLNKGIYGSLIYISANIVFLFILFGMVLEITKGGEFFGLAGMLLGRRVRGGAAQTTVVANALVGTVTGSPQASIAITVPLCLPLMNKSGFKSTFTSGLIAAGASGGFFLPPVMGAVAFMMMSLTGLSYWSICTAAFIPAILFFLGLGLASYFHSCAENLPPIKEEVDLRRLLRRAPLFLIPFTLIMVLLAKGFPPMYAAAWAMLVGMVLGFIDKETRPSWRTLVAGFTRGAKMGAAVAFILIILDMSVINIVSLTALGPKIARIVTMWGGGIVPLTLVLTMVVSMLMGMVAPISGSYLIVALIAGPVLTGLGVSKMAAHMFILYYATLGFLTPPVAPAVLMAAQMSGAPFLPSAWQSLRVVAAAYLLPFMFLYKPALLLQSEQGALWGIITVVVAILIVFCISIITYNHYLARMSRAQMGLAIISTVGFLTYFFTDWGIWGVVVGIACLLLLTLWQLGRKKTTTTASQNQRL